MRPQGAKPGWFASTTMIPGSNQITHIKMTKPAKAGFVILLAGGLGFEPRLEESESSVLPLDDPPKSWSHPLQQQKFEY